MSAGLHDELEIVEAYWAQLRAVDARLDARARARVRRRRLARTVAIAVLMLLLTAAAALAARALLFGDDAPRSFGSRFERLGAVEPGSALLLSVREPDVDGGPPWGARVFKSEGRICAQGGRVADGQLVGLGVAGAFGDDGQAHRLPVEAHTCVGPRPDGRFYLLSVASIGSRSGLYAFTPSGGAREGCLVPAEVVSLEVTPRDIQRKIDEARARGDAEAVVGHRRRLEKAFARRRRAPPPCAERDLRTVVVGLPGTRAKTATLSNHGPDRVRRLDAADHGAFIFVLTQGDVFGPDDVTVTYSDDTVCPIFIPGAGRPRAKWPAACTELRG